MISTVTRSCALVVGPPEHGWSPSPSQVATYDRRMTVPGGNRVNQEADVAPLGYVPALDGLRAVAVLLVMLLHAHFQLGKGGAIGVDIFFALSGFLITSLLLEERREFGSLSIGRFYARRALRLFPPLYAMLSVVLVYGVFFTKGSDRSIIFEESVATGLYVNNFAWTWGSRGLMLGHTWSLAVEEQFYLVWPLVLVVFLRRQRVRTLEITLVCCVALVALLRISATAPAIYGSRPDSLMVGCLAALLRFDRTLRRGPRGLTAMLAFSGLLIVGLFPILSSSTVLENGGFLVAAVLATIVVLGLIDSPFALSRVLSLPLFVAIGRISYALYLWHVPVFRWFSRQSSLPNWLQLPAKFLVTFALATLSWFLIERHTARWRKRFHRPREVGELVTE